MDNLGLNKIDLKYITLYWVSNLYFFFIGNEVFTLKKKKQSHEEMIAFALATWGAFTRKEEPFNE